MRRVLSGVKLPSLTSSRAPRLGRQIGDFLLFGFTGAELILLVLLTPSFMLADWIYVLQHLMVLAIAVTRRAPRAQDHALPASLAVAISCAYPYAQVIDLRWFPGAAAWPSGGLLLVTSAACLSCASLFSLGRLFGLRPAWRGLATGGPYGFVRHPIYLAYVLADIGYNLEEWNIGTLFIVIIGWASLLYRIAAEERVLAQDPGWPAYIGAVRYRLIPGFW